MEFKTLSTFGKIKALAAMSDEEARRHFDEGLCDIFELCSSRYPTVVVENAEMKSHIAFAKYCSDYQANSDPMEYTKSKEQLYNDFKKNPIWK